MSVQRPTRHDEDISGLPVQHDTSDPGLSVPLDDDEDCRISAAIRLRGPSGRRQLHERTYRRQREIPSSWVDVAQLVSMTRIRGATALQLREGFPGLGIGIIEYRRKSFTWHPVDWEHVLSELRHAVASGTGNDLPI